MYKKKDTMTLYNARVLFHTKEERPTVAAHLIDEKTKAFHLVDVFKKNGYYSNEITVYSRDAQTSLTLALEYLKELTDVKKVGIHFYGYEYEWDAERGIYVGTNRFNNIIEKAHPFISYEDAIKVLSR